MDSAGDEALEHLDRVGRLSPGERQARRGGADHDPRLVRDRRERRRRGLQVPGLDLQPSPHRGEGDLLVAQRRPAVAVEGLEVVERAQRLARRAGRGTHARVEVGDHEVQLAAAQQRGGGARVLEMEGGLGRPQVVERVQREAGVRARRLRDPRPAAVGGELERLQAVALLVGGAVDHHVQQREVAERRQRDEVEPVRAGERDRLAQLLPGALEVVRPQGGLPEHRVHECLAGAVVGTAGVPGGLGQQRVRGLQRGLEVALQPGLREAGERPRLQVPAAPRLRHRHLLGVLEVALGGLGVADVERRARERRGELGVLLEPVRWQLAQQRADGGGVAAHVQVEPVVGDDLHRQVPLVRLDRVPERVDRGAARGVPAGGAGVQLRQLGRQLTFGARAQQLGEQAVVAEPLAVAVHAEDEPVGALERGERVRAVAFAGERVGEAAAHAVDERRAQQERAQPRRLAIEHLGDEVVGDHAIVAGELGHEAVGVLAALQAQRREPQAGAPALRARVQRLDQLVVEGRGRARRAARASRPR